MSEPRMDDHVYATEAANRAYFDRLTREDIEHAAWVARYTRKARIAEQRSVWRDDREMDAHERECDEREESLRVRYEAPPGRGM